VVPSVLKVVSGKVTVGVGADAVGVGGVSSGLNLESAEPCSALKKPARSRKLLRGSGEQLQRTPMVHL
jgi:hypothetical protein